MARPRRQRSAGEDVLADPRVLVEGREHAMVREQDRLHADLAARRERTVERGEVGGPVLVADRFDHLDAHDRVVPTFDVAVVAQLHVDATRHPGAPRTLACQRGLLLRQREGGDGRTSLGGAHGERAPAGADLEHSGTESDPGRVEQRVDLAALRVGQGLLGQHFRGRKPRATSTSWSRRGTARTARSTGRSGDGCCRVRPTSCCAPCGVGGARSSGAGAASTRGRACPCAPRTV